MKQNNADFMELFATTEKEDKEVRLLSHEIRAGLFDPSGHEALQRGYKGDPETA